LYYCSVLVLSVVVEETKDYATARGDQNRRPPDIIDYYLSTTKMNELSLFFSAASVEPLPRCGLVREPRSREMGIGFLLRNKNL